MGILNYLKETKGEMSLVKWPTRKQTIIFTAVVIVISLAVAIILGAFDFLFTKIVAHFAIK